MNVRTYKDLTNCIIKNLHKIPRDVDLIVGIPRSGTMVASIIALYLNLPFTDIDTYINNGVLRTGDTKKCSKWISSIEEAKHVLIVDDSISSGKAMKETKQLLKDIDRKHTFMVVYALSFNCNKVDIYFENCSQPRIFEWNFMHHWELENSCMDIDGVICEDPRFFQNDDGKRYKQFILNAKPKLVPTHKVGRLVTSRLGEYRDETEQWLDEHNVDYDHLIMMENTTAAERALKGNHAEFKAEVYSNCDAILFIESEFNQAVEICKLSGKPVFCIENMELIDSENIGDRLSVKSNEFIKTVKHMIKKIMWLKDKAKEK